MNAIKEVADALKDAASNCAATIKEHEAISAETAEMILEDTERWEMAEKFVRSLMFATQPSPR